MDFALQAALLGAVMGSAVLTVSTIYGWTLPTAPKAYGWWATAFLMETASKASLLAGSTLVEFSDLAHGIAAGLTLAGAAAFAGRRPAAGSVAATVFAGSLWTVLAQIPRKTFGLLPLPLFGLGGIPLIVAGLAFAASGNPRRADGHKVAAATFILAGAHELAGPAMLVHPTLATWSLLLSQFLSMVMAVALLLVVLRRQQQQAEKEGARASLLESRLVDALHSVQDGVALYDAGDRLVTCNDRYREFLPLIADFIEPGRSFRDIVEEAARRGMIPEAAGREAEWVDTMMAEHHGAGIAGREQQYGDGRWVALSVYPTADGGHLRFLSDISIRKQAEQALQESVAWLKGVMDTVVDGIVTIDEVGTVLSFNPAAERIFGFDAGEVVGRNVKMLMPEPYHSEHDGYLARYAATGERHLIGIGRQLRGMRKDGSEFPLELSVAEMRQGEMTTFIGVIRDITDRKRVEDALVDSERRFRAQAFQLQAIIDNMAQGVAVFDGAENLLALNEVARELLDLPPESTIAGQTSFSAFLSQLAEEGGSLEGEAMEMRVNAIRNHGALVFEHARPSGAVVEVRSTAMPGGGFILTFTDITDRKRYEEALRVAKEAAERGNRAKATFLANISHELRTPLNAIIGFSELMKHEIFGPLEPSNYRNYVDDIHESGMHLLELINDILDMSKAEAGMTDLVESPVDVAAIVRSSLRMMARRAEAAKITLNEDLPADLPFIRADERRVRQIVLNLLSNAVKFTEEYGRVTVAARVEPDAFVLTVADTGIGMTAEDMVRVMEPFVQADTRLSRKYEGTGLGLPLTKALVTAHGGSFTLDSKPGVGTTARVAFPLSRLLDAKSVLAAEE